MFENSIDKKSKFTTDDGTEMLDLGESIFQEKYIFNGIGYYFNKVPKDMQMRPDLAAISAYNDVNDTELLLKYNNIQNPFTLYEDELLVIPSSTQLTKYVGTVQTVATNEDSLIRNYHVYVDKNKLPDTIGSEKNNVSIKSKTTLSGNTATRFKEANLAPSNSTPVQEINGRLYFGANSGMKCAVDGISTADYFKEVIKNSTNQ